MTVPPPRCSPLPGVREQVDHRRLPVLRFGYLQSSVDRQLEASIGEQAREAEDAFFWVTHHERGFWDMAMSG